jgi:hypothetical protein
VRRCVCRLCHWSGPYTGAGIRRSRPAPVRANGKRSLSINIGTADRPVGARRGRAHPGSVRGQEEDQAVPDRDQEEVA